MVPMNRLLRKKNFLSVLASIAAVSLAACGGGSHSSTLTPSAPVSSTAPGAPYTGPLADATFKITIPVPKTSAKVRRPGYVSSSTTKIVFTLNSATIAGMSGATLATFNTTNLGAKAVTLNSATCPGSGPWTCTLKIKLPPGTDNVTMSAEDASSNILSQQISNFTVVVATANSFSVTLDANAATFVVSSSSGFCAGAFTVSNAQTVATVGTTALTFNAAYTDLATKPIIGPGLPVLTVNGHTDDNSGAGYSDPGNLNTKVNQSTQSYTLFITTGSGTASVAVTSTHPAGDGLSFSYSLNHSIQAGPAPASGLLAAIEQTNTTPGSAAGQVDLITMTNPAEPTAFGATTTLSPTPAAPPKDVDNPQDLVFDTNGDLLIANGGAGSPDFGNFACIPAGAITTGANVATIITSHADDPISIALGTDSSVALANHAPPPPFSLVESLLGSSYAEASGTRELTFAQANNKSAINVVPLPATGTNPSGSFAATFSNGANPSSGNPCSNAVTPNSSQVIIKRPDGSTATINDNNNTVVEPFVGYDPADAGGVLVILSSGACNAGAAVTGSTAFLDTYTVGSTPTQISSQVIFDAGGSPDSSFFTYGGGGSGGGLAVSSTGYAAVGGALGGFSAQGPVVQVYQPGAGARALQGASIPFYGTTTSGGASAYCTVTCFITSLRFLNSHKLLIGFQTDKTALQGFYLYDVTSLNTPGSAGQPVSASQPCNPCFDLNGNPFGAGPTQVAFFHTTNHPLAAAYHP